MDVDTDEGTLVAAFERQARSWPQKVAIIDESGEWTFAELSQRVERIAARLIRTGVAPSTYVGLFVSPSADLVAALLAVLKVGAAYVPIDMSTPTERFRFVVEDAGVRFVITDDDKIAGCRSLPLQELLRPENEVQRVFPRVAGNTDAYVIYTSGSTGKPKGVVCTHHNVMRLLASTEEEFGFSQADRWSLFHSIAFDFSVWEVFGSLLYGGTLVVVEPDVARDTLRFARLLKDRGITVLNQTPSAFYNLLMTVESHGIDCFSQLRYVVLGGERVQCAKLARWFELKGDCAARMVNMYGITETTVHVTYREITAADVRAHPESSPIGRPIRDLAVYLLDGDLQPVAEGDAGEICVAGPGVAKGYLGRPELTAQRFASNPFDDGSRPKLYRSGDLGRRQGGEIFYLGRADRQVKVRGYRIELGDIESALVVEKGVAGSHVMALETGTSDARLVAHVIPDEKILPGAYAEAAFLQRRPGGLLAMKNGLEVAYLNRDETVFMYNEIFAHRLYERLGVTFRDGACVVDIGANIGMFSLLALTRCRNPQLIAVEPIPACAAVLDLNLKRYGADASVYVIGLSDHVGTENFRRFHQAQEKLAYTDVVCPLNTLSNLIDLEGLQHIDILKIDVEKSETEVLNGIREVHWPRIRQLVVGIHDVDGRLDRTRQLLEGRGYSCTIHRDALLRGTPPCNLYARRAERSDLVATGLKSTPAPAVVSERDALVRQLRTALTRKLPAYMIPAEIHLLPELPLTVNGKVDERKLTETHSNLPSRASREAVDSDACLP
jgi:amino acid adenylation domain-containing protein/FkbM family methyltransferase